MSPRIVICTCAVGCGHTRAALALRMALLRRAPGCRVQVVEAFDGAPGWFVRGYRDAYLAAIARVPRLSGWLYRMSDRPPRDGRAGRWIERVGLRRFLNDPSLFEADLVVTTHFLCARVLSDLRREGPKRRLRAPLAVCVTDQHPHGIWLVPGADRILVASEAARAAAIASGVAPDRVVATGIPIDPAFGSFGDRTALRRHMGLPDDRPIVLVCGGGLGLGGIEPTVRTLLSRPWNAHVLVVCGHNDDLRARVGVLMRRRQPGAPSCQVMGFTTRMPELMGAAHVLIGKPGGLTTAEAASSALPMVLLRPLPGQEERNAANLVSCGAAILHMDPAKAGYAAADLSADSARLEGMRRAARGIGCANAAERAAGAVLSLIGVGDVARGPAREGKHAVGRPVPPAGWPGPVFMEC